jgi:hypothetical protein
VRGGAGEGREGGGGGRGWCCHTQHTHTVCGNLRSSSGAAQTRGVGQRERERERESERERPGRAQGARRAGARAASGGHSRLPRGESLSTSLFRQPPAHPAPRLSPPTSPVPGGYPLPALGRSGAAPERHNDKHDGRGEQERCGEREARARRGAAGLRAEAARSCVRQMHHLGAHLPPVRYRTWHATLWRVHRGAWEGDARPEAPVPEEQGPRVRRRESEQRAALRRCPLLSPPRPRTHTAARPQISHLPPSHMFVYSLLPHTGRQARGDGLVCEVSVGFFGRERGGGAPNSAGRGVAPCPLSRPPATGPAIPPAPPRADVLRVAMASS